MIILETACDECVHYRGKVNRWNVGCDAFPEGIPKGFDITKIDVKKLRECNNGIKFEPKDASKDK